MKKCEDQCHGHEMKNLIMWKNWCIDIANMLIQNLVKCYHFVVKILSGNEIMTDGMTV